MSSNEMTSFSTVNIDRISTVCRELGIRIRIQMMLSDCHVLGTVLSSSFLPIRTLLGNMAISHMKKLRHGVKWSSQGQRANEQPA